MKQVQQDMMCALLQTLLRDKLITKDIHDKARERILGTLDWSDFFCYNGDNRKEDPHGST